MSWHSAWAMAVGGMIGGGIYTLAGVIVGVAGPLAWLSLLLGSLIALATVHSYNRLTLDLGREGVPITYLLSQGRVRMAGIFIWWLLLVYVLATAVYAYTFGQYIGRALGVSPAGIVLAILAIVTFLILINLLGIRQPAAVQISAVWIELVILGLLAFIGFLHWNPENLSQGVPEGSFTGVVSGLSATFIAFEGFEMLAYDVREIKSPRKVLTTALPAAVIAVAVAYALVTVGAASLVGASELVKQKENALAIAGQKAAGLFGLVVVTVAACSSATSAINATLFSVSRLARSAAESGLLPAACSRVNSRNCPHWPIIVLGVASAVLATLSSLEPLVQAASLAFLVLFAFVNGLAFVESKYKSLLSLLGALSSTGSAIIVGHALAHDHPVALGAFALMWIISVLANRRREINP